MPAFAGVLAAPIYSVNPLWATNLIIAVFAVVVIGGMGSIMGSIVTGFALGVIEGLTKVFYPRGLGHRGLRDHGDRAADPAGWPVRKGGLMIGCQRTGSRSRWSRHRAAHGRADRGLPASLYPVFLMQVLCFALFACAFNLLIGYVGLLSFGHAAFFGMGAYVAALDDEVLGLDAASSAIIARRRRPAAVLGLVLGYLAIRRQGIYFAMITLALAQMVYFFCLEAPFTGGEDGIQPVPRGHLFGVIDLGNDMAMYCCRARRCSWSASCCPPHHPFAVRPGAEGDPRERAARHLARLPHRPLQADRLRAVGGARRRCRRHQGAGLPVSPR